MYVSSQINPLQTIQAVDPSLTYINEFKAGTLVYLVQRNSSLYILKMAPLYEEWGLGYTEMLKSFLQREYEVLQRIKGVENVSQLEQVYETPNGTIALLKKYIEGTELKEGIYLSTKSQLRRTVSIMHERGISGLDLTRGRDSGSYKNIISSADGNKASLIDFDHCKLKEKDKDYEEKKGRDISDLSLL